MKKIIAILMSVSLSMMVFAGCASETPETPAPSETPSETPAETPAEEPVELKKLSIAYMPNYASLNTVVAGIEMGYFE